MNKSIPYLLTLSSNSPGMTRFLDSLKNITAEHIPVQFEPWNDRLLFDNIENIHCHEILYPGHVKKYNYVPRDLDPTRYIIFTDTDDVIFQKDFPTFTKDMYLAPENVTHRDTIYKNIIKQNPILLTLMDKQVYNSGCYAMKVPIFYEYLEFLTEMRKKVDINLNQTFFNLFIHTHKYTINNNPTIFCPIFANIHQEKLKKISNQWFYKNKLVSCVHGNGWTKEIL